MLSLAVLGCWIGYYFGKANLEWSIVATLLAVAAYPLAFIVLPKYVVQKADHYADSFFDAMLALDRANNAGAELNKKS